MTWAGLLLVRELFDTNSNLFRVNTDLNYRFSNGGTSRTCRSIRRTSAVEMPAQPVDATQALNLSAGVSNCKVSRGRSLS
jgi:hypothetical protein